MPEVVLDAENPRTYRDSFTGYEGIATARSEFIFGCTRVLLERQGKDGGQGEPHAEWFDEQRLVEVTSGEKVETRARTGGPQPTPPSRDPQR